jgi:hypothetical protein
MKYGAGVCFFNSEKSRSISVLAALSTGEVGKPVVD